MVHAKMITDVPNVAIKKGKMFSQWPMQAKIVAFILGLILYTYFILFLKGAYLKTRKLEDLTQMIALTEKLVEEVKMSDEIMETRLRELSNYNY